MSYAIFSAWGVMKVAYEAKAESFISDNFATKSPILSPSIHFVIVLLQYYHVTCKDSCPLISWIVFIISTIYSIRWQNILLHSVWVSKSAKIIHYCTQRSHLHERAKLFQYNLRTFALWLERSRLISKSVCETLWRANAPAAVRAFSMTQASVW